MFYTAEEIVGIVMDVPEGSDMFGIWGEEEEDFSDDYKIIADLGNSDDLTIAYFDSLFH